MNEMLGFAAMIALSMSFITGLVAHEKNRSFWIYFLAALLCWPIALGVACVRKRQCATDQCWRDATFGAFCDHHQPEALKS